MQYPFSREKNKGYNETNKTNLERIKPMFKTPHMLVTLYRSTRVIQRLHKERNFNVKNEGDLMNQIVEKVVSRKLTNDQIINEVIADHTIEFPLN